MDNFYIACDLGSETGRVMLGTLRKDQLILSEARRFQNVPVKEKDALQWNIPQLYHEVFEGLREIGTYEEPVNSISCHSWGADYLLFESDGSLIAPAFHRNDPRTETGMQEVLAKTAWEEIYDETGVQKTPGTTLFQLAAEKSRRLSRADHLMPIADGFNFLLSGVPRVEMSLASTTQLYNPVTRTWSDQLLRSLRLPPDLFPPVVPAGTDLGVLRPEIAAQAKLEDAHIVTSCSHELAAMLAGLPIGKGEQWAFLEIGRSSLMGTQLAEPLIHIAGRELQFTNEVGYNGAMNFYKDIVGLRILDECRHFWKETDRELEADVLMHLATSSTPFESLINPTDPRFLTPGEMPLKVQAFCKETHQPVPRKPGPIIRCVLESLALLHRKTLQEIEYLTGLKITKLYVLGDTHNTLLSHFTANALQVPVAVVPADAAAIGNVVVQALALGHIKSLEEARNIVANSFKMETITPHAAIWNSAYDRLTRLMGS